MNTLHVDLRPDWRGGQYQAWLLLRGLAARGHRAELLTRHGSALAARARASGIRVHEVPGTLIALQAARALRRLLRTERFDVVHAHEAHAHTALWLAGVEPSVARVVSRRVVYPPGGNWLSRRKYRVGVDHYIAVSESVRASLERAGVRVNTSVVYDGVELPRLPTADTRQQARAGFGLPRDAVVVGCLGALEPDKGHRTALEALPLIRQAVNAHLLLGGAGRLHGELAARIRSLGLDSAARLLGYVNNLETFFAATDIFLFPAAAEALGTSLLLAMAHQLPAIALQATTAAEVIRDGESGRLIGSPRPEAIAGAVVYLAQHRDLARTLGANARATIEERFTADRMVEGTLAVYQTLAEARLALSAVEGRRAP